VRRAIGPLWPILSAVYGLLPWHVELLTAAELNDYVAHAARHVAQPEAPAGPVDEGDGFTTLPI
jgi:hypothetical protein